MDINFELYKIFYHVASLRSFSAAADRLFISQSAVSQTIKSLEERLGDRLFVRQARNIRLTSEGELLFRHVEQAYNFLKTAESKLHEMHDLSSGEVRIGAGDTVCKHFLIPQLREFYRQHPKIKIQVINRTTSGLLSALKNGLIDFAIVTLPVSDPGVTTDELIGVRDIFVASDRFSYLKDSRVPLAELAKYPLLMLERNSATRRRIDSFFSSKGISLNAEIELESIDLLVEFAKIGLGVAHVLKESAQEALGSRELFEVVTEEALPVRNLGIATIRDVPLSRAACELVSILKSMLSTV